MDGLTMLGVLAVLALAAVVSFAKAAAKADEDATGARLAMQMRETDWRWPR